MVWEILLDSLRLFWRRIGVLLIANLLWLGLSLLIVTWPAATVGLFHLVRAIANEELVADPHHATIADFWAGFRGYWRPASLLTFGDLLIYIIIGTSLFFYGTSSVTQLNWLIGPIGLVGIAWTGAQIYLFPLLIQRPDRKPWELAREAFLMAISYPLNTFSLLLTAGLIGIMALLLAGPILLIFFAFLAILQTMSLRSVLAKRGELTLKLTPEQRDAQARKSRLG